MNFIRFFKEVLERMNSFHFETIQFKPVMQKDAFLFGLKAGTVVQVAFAFQHSWPNPFNGHTRGFLSLTHSEKKSSFLSQLKLLKRKTRSVYSHANSSVKSCVHLSLPLQCSSVLNLQPSWDLPLSRLLVPHPNTWIWIITPRRSSLSLFSP